MQIETYEIEEISNEAGVMAADAETIELCQKLGLSGQQELANPKTLTRVPYPKLTGIQRLVFSTLFPHSTPVEQYNGGIIPLRVLQVVAHCRENHLFDYLNVWHPEPGKVDPVLIGSTRKHSWENGDEFLLARWGTALLPFEQLAAKAKEVWMAARKLEINACIQRAESDLKLLSGIADVRFESGNGGHCYYQGLQ